MNFWQRKLLAFLHDPPHKALDIKEHEENRKTFVHQAGFSDDGLQWFDKQSDWWASAADRFPGFDSNLRSPFGGAAHPFKHPLGGSEMVVPEFPTPELLGERLQVTQPHGEGILDAFAGEERDRINFFLHWRRWPVEAAQKEWRSAFQPADTRLPDHPIWLHNSVTSALQGCDLKPAFLLFQLGPVQEFIAQARSTRDLWSGSYLLSWLMAHAIKAVTDQIGPDAIIYPFLRAQPLFDLLHKDIYEKISYKGDSLWSRMKVHEREILVPNLPNKFLALVPADKASELAQAAQKAAQAELENIADASWDWIDKKHPLKAEWRTRFKQQIAAFLQITWQVSPWNLDLPSSASPLPSSVFRFPPNPGLHWRRHYAEADRLLAARRNTRDFPAWLPDDPLKMKASKDTLSGKEEIMGDEDWWKSMPKDDELGSQFKSSDKLGAINLVKKVWHLTWLRNEWDLDVKKVVRFDSVPDIAAEDPSGKHVAVLAFDGDEMGKWLGGEKTPPLAGQFSTEARAKFASVVRAIPRPLAPSYHLQFSEALANFALYLVRPVVEHFSGQIIYAGGDDVLAMVPAARALDCSEALRNAFRGQGKLEGVYESQGANGGFVKLLDPKAEQPTWPLIVPGPNANASVGIAIGHMNAPLQGLVRAAQAAEKRAKRKVEEGGLGRSAFAMSIFKRSGEITEWGAKWDSGALELYREFLTRKLADEVSGKFAYALDELIGPYRNTGRLHDAAGFKIKDVIPLELERVLDRQITDKKQKKEVADALRPLSLKYLSELQDGRAAIDFPALFKTVSFITRGERE